MSETRKRRVWPWLVVLAALFYLSINAPQGWERVAHHHHWLAPDQADLMAPQVELPSDAALANDHSTAEPSVAEPSVAEPSVAEAGVADASASGQSSVMQTEVPEPPIAQDAGPSLNDVAATPNISAESDLNLGLPPVEPTAQPDAAMEPAEATVPESDVAAEERKASEPAARAAWPMPEWLLERLERLTTYEPTAEWARRAKDTIVELASEETSGSRRIELLAEIDRLRREAAPLAAKLRSSAARSDVLRSAAAIDRRQLAWKLAAASDGPQSPEDGHSVALADSLEAALAYAGAGPQAAAWRGYLHLDPLTAALSAAGVQARAQQRKLSREVLEKLHNAELSGSQRAFLRSQPLARLHDNLVQVAADRIQGDQLLAAVEQYESTGRASDARRLAEFAGQIARVDDREVRDLGKWIETNYRSANLRVELSEEFLNRLVPKASASTAPVHDSILGIPTHGCSSINTVLKVDLLPSKGRVQMALEADGLVASRTQATSGPVTLFSDSQSDFVARKTVELTTSGLRTKPAQADVTSTDMQLRDVRTEFDAIPILGSIVQSVARDKQAESEPAVREEVRWKISARASHQLDDELSTRVANADRALNDRVLAPMKNLGLDPRFAELSSSTDRMVVRMRVGGKGQLAANTPRPRAPGDSVLNVQVHQSAINNVADRLDLAGKEFTLAELRKHIAQKLSRADAPLGKELPEDITILFADQDPLHVALDGGEIQITLQIAELTRGDNVWNDFTVRAHYKPDLNASEPTLVRDGPISLSGKLGARGQVTLRSIFSKVFLPDRPVRIAGGKLTADPRLADLRVSQFVIDDGWLGIALKPGSTKVAAKLRNLK